MNAVDWLNDVETFDWGQKRRSRERSALQPVALFFVIYVGASYPLATLPRGA